MQQPFIHNRGFVCMRCREDILPARKDSGTAKSPAKPPSAAATAAAKAAGPARSRKQSSASSATEGYASRAAPATRSLFVTGVPC